MCPSVELFNSAKDTHAPRMNLCPAASDDDKPVTDVREGVQAAKRRHPTGSKQAAPQRGGIRPTRERSDWCGQAGRRPWERPPGSAQAGKRGYKREARPYIVLVPQGRHHGALRGIRVRRGDGKRRQEVASRGRRSPELVRYSTVMLIGSSYSRKLSTPV